jgi:RNA polymerase sigma-70 factor (ECF subfamily)
MHQHSQSIPERSSVIQTLELDELAERYWCAPLRQLDCTSGRHLVCRGSLRMSALPNLVGCGQIASLLFAVKNGSHPKTGSLPPSSAVRGGGGAAGAINEEQELIQQALMGDTEAQTRLFATYTPRLHRVAFKVLSNKEDAEDAVQEGWCRAYSKLHTFEGRSSFFTWLTRIIINSALMIRRKNKHQVQRSPVDPSGDQNDLQDLLIDERATPEEACGKTEMSNLLAREIDHLPSPTRTAFLLFEVGGFTITESTKMLGINDSALKSRVLRARRKLAGNIARRLYASPRETLIRKIASAANPDESRPRGCALIEQLIRCRESASTSQR